MAYEQLPVVKVRSADSPTGWMLINRADYSADRPEHHYTEGLAFHPREYPLFDPPTPRGTSAQAAKATAEAEAKAEAEAEAKAKADAAAKK